MAPKRASVSGMAASPAKKQKLNEDTKKCREVAAGLKQVEGMPREVATMLADMLESALVKYKDERHDLQERVVALGEQALRSHEAKLEAKIAGINESIAQNEVATDPLNKAAEAAEGFEKQKGEEELGCKRTLAEVAQVFQAAKQALDKAQEARSALDDELKVAADRKEELETMQKDLVLPLTEGGLEEDQKKSCASRLLKSIGGLGLEESILMAIPSSIVKAPEERGSFDTMVVSQFKEQVANRIRAAVKQLDEAEPTKAARDASVDEAKSALATAKSNQLSRAEDYWQSQAAHKAAQDELEAKWKAQKELIREEKKFNRDLQTTEGRLSIFRDGPLATYVSLRDRTKPEPVAAEVAVEAPAEEEAAVVEAVSSVPAS